MKLLSEKRHLAIIRGSQNKKRAKAPTSDHPGLLGDERAVRFGKHLRHATGFVERPSRLASLDQSLPDFSTLCRRQKTSKVSIFYHSGTGPRHLLISSRWIAAQCTVWQGVNCLKRLRPGVIAQDFDRQLAELHVRTAIRNRYTNLGLPSKSTSITPFGKGGNACKHDWRKNRSHRWCLLTKLSTGASLSREGEGSRVGVKFWGDYRCQIV
ncbi:transposase [Actibacterium sp. 188UL27-1]|uniref:transposase n=1 Tax=Actibacterium sp. 188UL27-1 TaxID=2786961 RepID=UPI001956287A|nr:transposase [Actibacterium sp. 188UL27-1]